MFLFFKNQNRPLIVKALHFSRQTYLYPIGAIGFIGLIDLIFGILGMRGNRGNLGIFGKEG